MAENWEQWRGRVIQGKFRLDQYLGGSDRAAVFLSAGSRPGAQKAAVKLVLATPANADAQLLRWKQAANLSHPHLMRVLEFGRCDLPGANLLYLATEYADESLAQILPLRPLTPSEAQEMLRPVLDVLTYLHHAGFVHGHLRPSNVLAVNDQLKLSSDGIVKINEPSGRAKRDSYDPPEIATMMTSPAGDVWSLGMLLSDALTQQLPSAPSAAIDNSRQEDPAVPASIPEPFQEIVRNCLRSDPRRRWTVERISGWLQSSLPATSSDTTSVPREPSAKRGFWILVAAVIVILAIAAGVELTGSHNRASSDAPSQPASEVQASQATSEVPPQAGRPHQQASVRAGSPANIDRSASTPDSASFPPGVIHQVMPAPSQGALNTVHGKVRVSVKVAVDPAGNVTDVTFVSHGPSEYFARLAHNAAAQWKFAPAQMEGQNVASEWLLKFAFGRKGTEVAPSRVVAK
jgi:serine/threonine protein kinase